MDKVKKTRRSPETHKQPAFIRSFVDNNGNVSAACREVDISRQTYHNWRRDKRFRSALRELEDKLFASAVEDAFAGEGLMKMFVLKALNRARFDDAYARQERAMKKGVLTNQDGANLVIRPILVREEEPERLRVNNPETNGNGRAEH